MSKPAIALLSSLLAAPVLALPPHAHAARAERPSEVPDIASIRVVIDATALGEAGEFFEQEVHQQVTLQLEDAGYFVVDAVDADVTVRVRLSFYNEDDLDYQIDVDISSGAELIRLETLGCPQCVDADLLEKVATQGPELQVAIEDILIKVGTSPETLPETEEANGKAPAPLGALGAIGIGVATLGLGATLAGAIELGRGKIYEEGSISVERSFVDHTTPGIIFLSTGVTAALAGTIMVVVDLTRRSKQRKRAQTSAAYPLVAPGVVGFGYTLRF